MVDIFDTGTWEKSLNATDCTDLQTKMTPAEQLRVSTVLLATMRMQTLATAPAPDARLNSFFYNGMAALCTEQGGAYPLIAAAAVVYTMDKQYEPAYR